MKRLVQVGSVRTPRGRVLAGGEALAGVLAFEVTTNGHYQADHFRLELALNHPGGRDLTWWGGDALVGALFDIRVTMDGDEKGLILGEADRIDIHPHTGLIEIEGQDLTRRFIQNRGQETFSNQTSSEVAITLAKRRGLTPVVTATTTPVSRFFGNDHDQIRHDQFSHVSTEWDLLTFLAEAEGFDVFVAGRSLYFLPAVDPDKTEPFDIHWNQDSRISDVTRLDLGRSLTLAKGVVVVVRSWQTAHGRSFSRTSPAGGARAKIAAGIAQRYVITRPNLTEDQAQKLADSVRADITKHERTLSFDCPGELDLSSRDILQVSGVGGWDQRYFVNEVTRRLSIDGGFVQTVMAKNHNIESQASIS